jgi:hypothetical protein
MKVFISADSIKFPISGIASYTYELAHQLHLQSDLELLLFANGSFELNILLIEKIKPSIFGHLRSRLSKET